MYIVVGYLIAIVSILGGYMLSGGHVWALLQPLELLMIAGGAGGAFIAAHGGRPMRKTLKALPELFRPAHRSRDIHVAALSLLYEILNKLRRDGVISLESDIDNPDNSVLFTKYVQLKEVPGIIIFITDYFRLVISGTMDAFDIETLMEAEIDTAELEWMDPVHNISKTADALPAFGIVAAVMGVVHTMESASLPPAELGVLIAHALVGTFLGILLAYGFVAPVAHALEHRVNDKLKILESLKVTMVASLNGYPPNVAVEFGRKVLKSDVRPTFAELEALIKTLKSR